MSDKRDSVDQERRPVNIVDDADDPKQALRAFIGQEMEAAGFDVSGDTYNAIRLEGPKRIYWLDVTVIEKRNAR